MSVMGQARLQDACAILTPSLFALQVLSGDLVARIWRGEITRWNDSAIVALNPDIGSRLPDAEIRTSFRTGSAVSSTTVFKRALHVFTNGSFPRGGLLEDLPPAASLGTSQGFSTDAQRINFVKVPCVVV